MYTFIFLCKSYLGYNCRLFFYDYFKIRFIFFHFDFGLGLRRSVIMVEFTTFLTGSFLLKIEFIASGRLPLPLSRSSPIKGFGDHACTNTKCNIFSKNIELLNVT